MLKDLTKVQKAVLAALAGLIVVSAGAVAMSRSRSLPPDVLSPPAIPTPPVAPLTVHVTGAVVHPGLYTLRRGDRVAQAVEAAGGLTADADSTRLNLARRLKDGDRVNVSSKRPAAPAGLPGPRSSGPPSSAPPAGAPPSPSPPVVAGPVNLNSATASQLARLPGLTPKLAGKIVAYRSVHGAFRRVEELLLVEGMTPAILAQVRPYVEA
jgi:competence protein ComEA